MGKHKHAELIKAWADGAKIQYMSAGKWYDAKNPAWHNETNEFRIKPKSKEVRWQWFVISNCDGAVPCLTSGFYRTRSEAREHHDETTIVLQKAEWTKTEFEE